MNWILIRNIFLPNRILGDLLISHRIFCHSCEFLKQVPVIAGKYKVSLYKDLPVLFRTNGIGHARLHGTDTKIRSKSAIMFGYNIDDEIKIWGDAEEGIIEQIKNSKDQIILEIVETKF